MNTVMRTLGGALGGQLSATFIAANTAHGLPTVTGFTETFLMATGFLWCAGRSPCFGEKKPPAGAGGGNSREEGRKGGAAGTRPVADAELAALNRR